MQVKRAFWQAVILLGLWGTAYAMQPKEFTVGFSEIAIFAGFFGSACMLGCLNAQRRLRRLQRQARDEETTPGHTRPTDRPH